MPGAVFLSASLPDPARAPEFAATADPIAIASAVSAVVHVCLGRRSLVFGGHPAITPMVWMTAEELGVDYGAWVKLYQTNFFRDDFPEDNAKYQNVRFVDPVDNDLAKSLLAMRVAMFTETQYCAAIFIGGMAGVLEEHALLKREQPSVTLLPLASTGAAALALFQHEPGLPAELRDELNYVPLLHHLLKIPVTERRYASPNEQPADEADRQWQPTDSH